MEEKFMEAYDAHAESILRHAIFRVSDKKVAEDIVSETFTKTWDYMRNNNEVKNFKGFLYKIADNLITDHYRAKQRVSVPIETIDEARLTDNTDLPAEMELALSFEIVKNHLQFLPEEHRDILVYRYIDGFEIAQIRELTGKSMTNIYVIIHRALKNLRKKIKTDENENR